MKHEISNSPFMRTLILWGTIGILAAVVLFAIATSQGGSVRPAPSPSPSVTASVR
jgi:hypothetical protein